MARRQLNFEEDASACLATILPSKRWAAVAQDLNLTPRQRDIVYLMLQAKKDKQIATELGLQITTVRMHLRHIFREHRVVDRMELTLRIFHLACKKCPGHNLKIDDTPES